MKSVAGVVVNLDRGRVVYTGSAVCGQRRRNSVATGRAWFFPCENGQIISEVISEVMSETSHTEEVDLDHVRMRECVWT